VLQGGGAAPVGSGVVWVSREAQEGCRGDGPKKGQSDSDRHSDASMQFHGDKRFTLIVLIAAEADHQAEKDRHPRIPS